MYGSLISQEAGSSNWEREKSVETEKRRRRKRKKRGKDVIYIKVLYIIGIWYYQNRCSLSLSRSPFLPLHVLSPPPPLQIMHIFQGSHKNLKKATRIDSTISSGTPISSNVPPENALSPLGESPLPPDVGGTSPSVQEQRCSAITSSSSLKLLSSAYSSDSSSASSGASGDGGCGFVSASRFKVRIYPIRRKVHVAVK